MWERIEQVLNQAADRIIGRVAEFLPGVLALLLAVLVAVVLGWIVRFAIRRSLAGIGFDRRLQQWGFVAIAEWSASRSPTQVVARLAYWTVVGLGLLVGVSALDASLTAHLAMRLFSYVPDVAAAGVVLLVGSFAARFLARGVLIGAVNMQIQSARLLSLGVKWLVFVLAGAMALEHLGIGGQIVRVSFAILFGGIVLALALAVGLGSKDMVSRTWERQQNKSAEAEDPLRHL